MRILLELWYIEWVLQEATFSYAAAVGLFEGVIGLILVSTANFLSKKFTETSLW